MDAFRPMAIDPIILSKRRKKLPRLWALVDGFMKKHGGRVHLNWGAPFSVRTKLREGRLEVDFSPKRLLLRFEQLRLPEGVSFTTNRDLFQGPYPRKIGRPAIDLGWEVQGGEEVDEKAIRAFLQAPANAADLRHLELGKGEWVSIDPTAAFLTLSPYDLSRLDGVVETLRGMARRHAAGVVALPKKPRGPRLTGRRPSAAQLRRWPNWRQCLDEEDEEGQDETTIRPDDEQAAIGPETSGTALEASSADGRCFPAFALASGPEDLPQGDLDEIVLLEPRGARTVSMRFDHWKPQPETRTLELDDPRLPIRMCSVLLLPDGRRLELTLERGGRVSRVS
jgi:hypothetical protein